MDAALVTAKPETLDQLMTQIEQQHASMPKRLREIGNFVLGHPEAIALSTLAELAAETDIATSAFVRFAQTLGFDGFSQMQALFRQQVRSSWPQYASRLSDMADVDPADHFEALSVSAVESINRLSNTVSMEQLDAAVQKLTDAETIWFAAGGRSKPVTVYMSYVLTKLGIRSQEFREAPAEAMRELNLVGPRDVLLAVSFAPWRADGQAGAGSRRPGNQDHQHHRYHGQPGRSGHDPSCDRGEHFRVPVALRDDESCPVSRHRDRVEAREGRQECVTRRWM